MANKYIIHGATYCGDGTSPAQASSDGGVGAWNNINVFTATAKGALVAGDTVFIRSKTAAGAFAGGIPEGAGELMNVARFENASCIF